MSGYVSCDSIKRLAAVLPDSGFLPIERSLLINIGAILHAQCVRRGTYLFTLRSGSVLRSDPNVPRRETTAAATWPPRAQPLTDGIYREASGITRGPRRRGRRSGG